MKLSIKFSLAWLALEIAGGILAVFMVTHFVPIWRWLEMLIK